MDLDQHKEFMREAVEQAKLSLVSGDWPIGCVIVNKGEIIAKGRNTVYSTKNRLAHAEIQTIQSIQGICWDNSESLILYTTYDPCPMCFGAIILNRIARVFCGTELDGSSAIHLQHHLPKLFKQDKFHVQITTGVLANECSEVFLHGEPTNKLLRQGNLKTKKIEL